MKLTLTTLLTISSIIFTSSMASAWNPTYRVCTFDDDTVNVRTAPTINSKVAYKIPVDTWVEVKAISNGWGKIFFKGNSPNSQNWVRMDLLCKNGYGHG